MISKNWRGLLVWGKMGTNPYRFVPYQWLTAASASDNQNNNYQRSYHSNAHRNQTSTAWNSSSQSGSRWTNNSRTEYRSFTSSSRQHRDRQNGTGFDDGVNDVSSTTTRIPEHESSTKMSLRYQEYYQHDHGRDAYYNSQRSMGMSSSNLFGSSRCDRRYSSNTRSPRHHFSMHHRWLKNRSPFESGSPDKVSDSQQKQYTSPGVMNCRLNREWEDIELPDHITKRGTANKRIRIVCYNILSQTLLEINDGLYRDCDPAVLSWEYRWTNLKREMEELNADVLCLQEIEEFHYQEQIHPWLEKQGYECHYKKRTGNNRMKPDGVLTAFKAQRFKLVKEKKVAYFRNHHPLVNQHNVGIITLLQPVNSESKTEHNDNNYVCIANTHLLYSPKRGDTKLVQLCTLFAEIDRLISCTTKCKVPIVLCGDFNSIPHSYLYDFITKQELLYEGVKSKYISGQKASRKGQDFYVPEPLLPKCLNISTQCTFEQEKSATDISDVVETRVPYTIWHELGLFHSAHDDTENRASTIQDRGVTVDYIFYTPSVCVSEEVPCTSTDSNPHSSHTQLYLSRRIKLVRPEELDNVENLPNAEHSSDHIPVVAEFILVPSNS